MSKESRFLEAVLFDLVGGVPIIDSATSNHSANRRFPSSFSETRTHNAVHEIEVIDDGAVQPVSHDVKGNLGLPENYVPAPMRVGEWVIDSIVGRDVA